MKKCLLCERKMIGANNFGKGCLKKMYNIMGIYDSKSIKTEQILNEEILKLCNKKELPKEQNRLLVDRYLTLNILNHVPIPAYDKYKTALKDDVNLITDKTNKEDLKSFDLITLKQSAEVYKIYQKYEQTFQKIMNGDYDDLQNISFDIVRFAFSKYYNKKTYLSDELQVLQYGILQMGVIGLTMAQCKLSAKLLEHSLNPAPEDIIITEDKYINRIQKNDTFKEKINKIVEKYKDGDSFDTGIGKETITFGILKTAPISSFDLLTAIHNGDIQVIGKKNKKSNWDLDIIITDRYDFTVLQKVAEYVDNGIWSVITATANNFAMIATSCNVVHEYNITIKFQMKDWK